MSKQLTRRTQDMIDAVKDGRIPPNVRAIAEGGVAKTRMTYSKMNSMTKDGMKAFEDVIDTAHSGAKIIGEKILSNTEASVEAALDAAQAVARAKSLPEAASLQANFMQQQLTLAGAQAKEIFDLSAKVAQQTFESMNSARMKALENLHKTG